MKIILSPSFRSILAKSKIFITAASICFCFAHISAFDSSRHLPRNGDRLHPAVAFNEDALTFSDSSKVATVDLSNFSYDPNWDYSVYNDGDTINWVQNSTKQTFILRGDSLHYLGLENRDMLLSLSNPLWVISGHNDGYTTDHFHGNFRLFGANALKMLSGNSMAFRDYGWSMTDGADTVRNLSRLVWKLDMAYYDADSLDLTLPDSLLMDKVSDHIVDMTEIRNERLLTIREIWVSDEARYPVASLTCASRLITNQNVDIPDTIPLSYLAMYLPPAHQYADTGDEDWRPKPKARSDYGNTPFSNHTDTDSLIIGEPEQEGPFIAMTVSTVEGNRDATFSLYSENGIILSPPMETKISQLPQQIKLAIPSGIDGVILIRITTLEREVTKKVMIN